MARPSGPIKVLDGGLGTELIINGQQLPEHIWSAHTNLNNPELLLRIHKSFIRAGAQYITTNTFRTTQRAYAKTGLSDTDAKISANNSLAAAVDTANQASNGSVKVMGSIAPLEDCYRPDLYPGSHDALYEFGVIGSLLNDAGVDGFLIETMNNIDEAESCLSAVKDFHKPVWIGFNLSSPASLLSGEPLKEALALAHNNGAECILLNCNPLELTLDALDLLSESVRCEWGIYPNLGLGLPSPDGKISELDSDENLLSLVESAVEKGASVIGGCCGSSPRHIGLISNYLSKYC